MRFARCDEIGVADDISHTPPAKMPEPFAKD
jgi:hypothetical protein